MSSLRDEIWQQPVALAAVRKYYTSPGAIPDKVLSKLAPRDLAAVIFTGMGSSLHAALPAQAYLTQRGIRALVWETAELLHHHLKVLKPDTLVVAISQSGETGEITQLLENLPAEVGLVAVTNVEKSTLARRAGLLLPLLAGSQSSVSTKTYMCSVATLMYLAFAIAGEAHRPLTEALIHAIEAQEQVLDRHGALLPPTLEFFGHPPYVALMSRGADLASAYQGALMLKEVARLAAEPMSAAQFRHGPIEIVNPAHRYIIFARSCEAALHGAERTEKLLLNLASDIRSHGGRVLLLTDSPLEDLTNVRLISVEPVRLGLGTLVDTLHIQLLAHDTALRAGLDPGKFWIAESVTRKQ